MRFSWKMRSEFHFNAALHVHIFKSVLFSNFKRIHLFIQLYMCISKSTHVDACVFRRWLIYIWFSYGDGVHMKNSINFSVLISNNATEENIWDIKIQWKYVPLKKKRAVKSHINGEIDQKHAHISPLFINSISSCFICKFLLSLFAVDFIHLCRRAH